MVGVLQLSVAALAAASAVAAQTPYFDGRFYKKTWPNAQVFDNQTYYGTWVHGVIPTAWNMSHYLALSPSYKNPWDKIEQQGVSVTVSNESYWLAFQPFFRRTELVPLSPDVNTQNVSTDTWYYYASVKQDEKYQLDKKWEHQLLFHERDYDYTQNFGFRYGGDTAGDKLQFYVENATNGNRDVKWESNWNPKTWYNFVIGANFKNKQITMYTSTDGHPLRKAATGVAGNLKGGQFHIGQLKFVNETTGTNTVEKLWYSGVKVEKNRLSSTFGWGADLPPYKPPTTTTKTTTTLTKTTTKGYTKPTFVKVAIN
ncbi:hypothetical protein HDV00_007341 [Rhizophlyctis rosea]|nr:hypothetical protein HDV00_007341 [Rhizophlyctis rosea]